jgi:hypothetical protein
MKKVLPYLPFLVVDGAAATLVVVALFHHGNALRWTLLVLAFACLLVARSFGAALWLDVLALSALAAVIAVADRAANGKPAPAPRPAARARFSLPVAKLVVEKNVGRAKKALVVVVVPKTGRTIFVSRHYDVTLPDGAEPNPSSAVPVSVARGTGDTTVTAFAADLVAATTIFVFPGK